MKERGVNVDFHRMVRGFTLVELLASLVILSILLVLMVGAVSMTQGVWQRETAKVEDYEQARRAMDALASRIGEANLDGYWAYEVDEAGRDYYARASDGHFISGEGSDLLGDSDVSSHALFFQCTRGISESGGSLGKLQFDGANALINATGFYVGYDTDVSYRPAFLSSHPQLHPLRGRFRLMEFCLPTELTNLYSRGIGLNEPGTARESALRWFRGPFQDGSRWQDHVKPVADNVLALIVAPEWLQTVVTGSRTTSMPAKDFSYDTRQLQWGEKTEQALATQHQLPPRVRLILLVTDEKSYQKLEQTRGRAGAKETVFQALASRFSVFSRLQGDLDAAEAELMRAGLATRTFAMTVALRGSKWIIEKDLRITDED